MSSDFMNNNPFRNHEQRGIYLEGNELKLQVLPLHEPLPIPAPNFVLFLKKVPKLFLF